MLEVASQLPFRLHSNDRGKIVARLTAFCAEILSLFPLQEEQAAYYLKFPLACFVLPELAQIFDAKFVYVLRQAAEIEQSRKRRKWRFRFGPASVAIVHSLLFDFYIEQDAPIHFVKYKELLANLAKIAAEMIAFCGIKPNEPFGDIVGLVRVE